LGEFFFQDAQKHVGQFWNCKDKKKVISAQNIWAPLGKTLMLEKIWAF
jgi:hypothetical protein